MRYLDSVSPSFRAAAQRRTLAEARSPLQMCTNSPEGLLTVANKNNTLDLCQTICEYVEASRWEIGESSRFRASLDGLELTFAVPISSCSSGRIEDPSSTAHEEPWPA